nr:DUF4956 domain-containing protein [uncultured Bacteroides sp.]
MDTLSEWMSNIDLLGTPLLDANGFGQLIMRFLINFVIVTSIIHFFYYPKSRRRDYYFTFSLINVSVFLLIFLLNSVKIKIGFALGVFAIFGIIRYRTESVPIREMTYLFLIIAVSVINAVAVQISYAELFTTNILFVLITWALESSRWLKHTSCKLILYDKINLITPDKYEELMDDLKKRTGIDILKVEVGHLDFLRDTAYLKIYYEPLHDEINTIDTMTRLPKDDE